MLIIMTKGSTQEDVARVSAALLALGCGGEAVRLGEHAGIVVTNGTPPADPWPILGLPGVARVVPLHAPFRAAARGARAERSTVRVGAAVVGSGGAFVIAGPCAVETEEQVLATARLMKAAGADALRGGAYKPRSNPYTFQGLGRDGLAMLAKAREETGLPIVTEAMDEASLDLVAAYADVVQIGARNMQNYPLLKKAGRAHKPVLLKRGAAATLEEWLLAAEYLLAEGNPDVILCERGVRTFSLHSRYTLDLSVIPAARELTHLPIVVDPSHATGRRDAVPAMARAAIAAGADGVMFEVHPVPEEALSDGRQALLPRQASELIPQLREIAALVARRPEAVR